MDIICHGLGNGEELTFQINDHGIFIGSDEKNEIVLTAEGVSGRHIHLFACGHDLMLEDSGSLNGTFLNGFRTMEEIRLKSGDCIQIGTRQIRIETGVAASCNVPFHVFFEEPDTSVFQQNDKNILSVSASDGKCNNLLPVKDGEMDSPEENGDEFATAMTMMADADIKALIKAGKFDELQRIGESSNTSANVTTSMRTMLTEGKVIGKYKIVRKIGKGGMGVIYLAKHETLNAYRALKVLSRELSDENNQFFERFLREARIASEIHHPNVVGVMDVETDMDYGVSYIVMEYIDGGSLRRVLKSRSKLTEEQAVVIVQGVAEALSAAAEHKIVHRDIKPDNIMFTKRGDVKLADLGIAKNDNDDVNLTKTNIMIGTPAYLSPEQVENPKGVDIRSDIYSLGATFYEMLTGQHPYVGATTYDVIHKLFSDPVPDPRDKNPDVSTQIAKIVMKMLDKEPGKRYQSPTELLMALAASVPQYSSYDVQILIKSAITGSSPENLSATLFTSSVTRARLKRRAKWKRLLWFSLTGIAVFAIAGIGIYVFLQQKNAPRQVPFSVQTPQPNISVSPPVIRASASSEIKLFSLRLKTEPDTKIQIISPAGVMTTYMTPASGTVHIKDLISGIYTLKAQCQGRKDYDSEISITQNHEITIPLQLDNKSATFATLSGATLSIAGKSGFKKHTSVPASGIVKYTELPLDSYTVRIVRDGYRTEERTFVLNDDTAMQIPLTPLQVSLHIATTSAAEIELTQNGVVKYSQKAESNGICLLPKLRKGDYHLKISLANFKTRTCKIELHEDMRLDLPLNPVVKDLTIYASPYTLVKLQQGNVILKEARANADGKLILSSLPVGKYEVFFSKDGFQPTSQNISLSDDLSVRIAMKQLTLTPMPEQLIKKGGIQPPTQYGTALIKVNASPELLAYVMKNGLEIRIDAGDWEKIKTFPFEKKLPEGKAKVRIRGNGIQPLSAEQIFIKSGGHTGVFFTLMPMPAKVTFSSNISGAEFFFLDMVYPVGASASIEPFKQYPLRVRADGFEEQKRIVSADIPGMTTPCQVTFERKKIPFVAEFTQGMELLKNKKYEDALRTLSIAGNGGHPDAAYQVGIIYEKGLGMWFPKKGLALEWYRKAAANGHIPCTFLVAEAIRNGDIDATEKEMFSFYLQAAKGKHAQAAYLVAQFYEKGMASLPADEQKAIQFLELAAELQHPVAMFELGLRYENGKGVPVSSEHAIEWYKKAAATGLEKAQKRLAVLKRMEQ